MNKPKRWQINTADKNKSDELFHSLKINSALCKILVQRDIETYEEAKNFFRPQLSQLHSPWLMKDMRKAVERIVLSIHQKEKILVFGDYDVDGTTAVSSMYQFLKKLYNNVEFYIPHRYREGYGISKAGIDFASENGFTLIIALDCGIKSVELISYAKESGVDFIVCDHHLPGDELPAAVAILNPKQKNCSYPYKELCGCGVGFKLICALAENFGLAKEETYVYLDLLATAIAADIVSMTGENRIMAYYGLKKANSNPNYGIKALSTLSGLVKEIHIHNLVFMIAPRVNAAGRMDDARKAVLMFVSESLSEAMNWAEQLHSDNFDRKEADSNITQEALAIIAADEILINKMSTVVFQPHWHKGVVGIVASRLIDHYHRPTIVLTQSGEYVAGSARSVNGFNIYEAIHQCKDLLLGYGGHFFAAGMTMENKKVEAFCQRFEEVVSSSIHPDLLIPQLLVDTEIRFKDITLAFFNIIDQMEPFGPGNLNPVFITKGVIDTGYSKLIKEKHIRFVLKQDGIILRGIGFDMAEKMSLVSSHQPLDIVYKICDNEWNGETSLQLKIIDINLSEVKDL